MSELDEALERFQQGQLEFAGGLANHGPMAAEALVRLGHPALVPHLVRVYAPRLGSFEPHGRPLADADWGDALGRPERFADWVATFENAFGEAPWREVLAGAIDRLADGLFAGATHGWLRVAHAVRALEEEETPVRRAELVHGLAYWAGRWQRLPGEPGALARAAGAPSSPAEEALASLPIVPPPRRRPGFFFDAVRVLDDDEGFRTAVGQVDPAEDELERWLGDLCRAAARLYLANPAARIAYVHTVTAPSALRLAWPLLTGAARRRLVGLAFQAAAALHAVSAGDGDGGPDAEVEKLAEDPAEIRYRAACSLEEHAIKMAEACLREDAIRPDPVLRLAAADAALRIEPSHARLC